MGEATVPEDDRGDFNGFDLMPYHFPAPFRPPHGRWDEKSPGHRARVGTRTTKAPAIVRGLFADSTQRRHRVKQLDYGFIP
jgi:hypothetical protein